MGDLINDLKDMASRLQDLASASGKYVILHDINGQINGKQRVDLMQNGNVAVDLGLPSGKLWANRNVGAALETDSGMYFSWGNRHGYDDGQGYDFSNAVYQNTEGYSLGTNIPLSQDIAHAYMGGNWRLPTDEEFAELFNSSYTTAEWVTVNGISGRRVTSKSNGNSIFLPAAGGFRDGTSLDSQGTIGRYWSSTIIDGTSARSLTFNSSSFTPQNTNPRRFGFPARAIM